MTSAFESAAWQQLQAAHTRSGQQRMTIRGLFDADPQRFDKFSVTTEELVFDFSKNLLNDEILSLLLKLAGECGVPDKIDRLFRGDPVNTSEHRPALHVALRGHHVDAVAAEIADVQKRMFEFVDLIRSGNWRGYSGELITDVVNIGIGGSHLGPAMTVRALENYSTGKLKTHFISNVDPAAASRVLSHLHPATTLFIVASKSFSTLETQQNALLARRWFLARGGVEKLLAKHFIAVSSNIEAAKSFGINEKNIFPMWDWVGGRYSLWSAIGLPVALDIGAEHFHELLAGAQKADEHFRNQELGKNIPFLMGALNVWYSGFFGATSQAILPYSQSLELFPAYLQQLSMESLGKSVTLEGTPVRDHSGLVVWGAPGTDGQHSFHQLLHQGSRMVPADFIAVTETPYKTLQEQQNHLLANCLAQSQALMDGITLEQAKDELLSQGLDEEAAVRLAPHKVIPGNRPSNTLLLHELTPHSLGFLCALYEHAVYVQSALWHINAFDQWGVELGKKLSTPIFNALETENGQAGLDGSTANLIAICKSWRKS